MVVVRHSTHAAKEVVDYEMCAGWTSDFGLEVQTACWRERGGCEDEEVVHFVLLNQEGVKENGEKVQLSIVAAKVTCTVQQHHC